MLTLLSIPPSEHLRRTSPGLTIVDRSGTPHTLADPNSHTVASRVVRTGPFAVALRFESTPADSERQNVPSTVDLHFPVPRSRVEMDWKIGDPHDRTSVQKRNYTCNWTNLRPVCRHLSISEQQRWCTRPSFPDIRPSWWRQARRTWEVRGLIPNMSGTLHERTQY